MACDFDGDHDVEAVGDDPTASAVRATEPRSPRSRPATSSTPSAAGAEPGRLTGAITRTPARTRASTISEPRPDEPPVTRATRPVRSTPSKASAASLTVSRPIDAGPERSSHRPLVHRGSTRTVAARARSETMGGR